MHRRQRHNQSSASDTRDNTGALRLTCPAGGLHVQVKPVGLKLRHSTGCCCHRCWWTLQKSENIEDLLERKSVCVSVCFPSSQSKSSFICPQIRRCHRPVIHKIPMGKSWIDMTDMITNEGSRLQDWIKDPPNYPDSDPIWGSHCQEPVDLIFQYQVRPQGSPVLVDSEGPLQ